MRSSPRAGSGVLRDLLAVSLPMVASHACETVMMFTDRLFLSRLGPEHMSAAMAGGLTGFMLTTFFIGLTGYSAALVAQYYGAGQIDRCARTTTQAALIALLAYPVILAARPLALGWFAASGIAPEQLGPQTMYFNLILSAVIVGLLRNVLASFFIGIGRTRVVLAAALVSMAANVALNYVLVFGKLGFPALGIRGAAYGTIVGGLVGLGVILSAYLGKANRNRASVIAGLRFDPALMRQLIRFGTPAGLELFLNLLAFTVIVLLFHTHSLASAAAATIMFNWDMVSFVPLLGIEIGVTSLVGRAMGRGDPDAAHAVTHAGLKLGWIYSAVILALFLAVPGVLVDWFQPAGQAGVFAQARPIAVTMIRLASIYVLVEAVLMVYIGALRGAGDTLWAMVLSVGMHWLMALSLAVTLRGLGASPETGWTVLVITFFASVFFVVGRYRRGAWREIRLVPPEPVPVLADEFHEHADV